MENLPEGGAAKGEKDAVAEVPLARVVAILNEIATSTAITGVSAYFPAQTGTLQRQAPKREFKLVSNSRQAWCQSFVLFLVLVLEAGLQRRMILNPVVKLQENLEGCQQAIAVAVIRFDPHLRKILE